MCFFLIYFAGSVRWSIVLLAARCTNNDAEGNAAKRRYNHWRARSLEQIFKNHKFAKTQYSIWTPISKGENMWWIIYETGAGRGFPTQVINYITFTCLISFGPKRYFSLFSPKSIRIRYRIWGNCRSRESCNWRLWNTYFVTPQYSVDINSIIQLFMTEYHTCEI